MPLSLTEPAGRSEVHTRNLEIKVYRREDGLWDVEGHLVDTKPYTYLELDEVRAPGQPVHDMWLRLTVDDDLVIVNSAAAMPTGAYGMCHQITPNFAALEGLQIGSGWNRRVRELVGGVLGCTHLVEMLAQLATTVLQSIWTEREREGGPAAADIPRQNVNTCHTYRSDGPFARRHWPELYTGKGGSDAER